MATHRFFGTEIMPPITIRDDVPPPEKGYTPRTEAGRAARDMKVGASAFCQTHSECETLRAALYCLGYSAMKRRGMHEGERGWWVWKLERK